MKSAPACSKSRSLIVKILISRYVSIAEKSFSLYPEFNFVGHKFVSLENKTVLTNKKKESGPQNLPLEFLKFLKMQPYGFSKIIKITKIHKSVQN